MFGGSATGKILEIDAPSRLVLEWRFRNWKESDTSKVSRPQCTLNDNLLCFIYLSPFFQLPHITSLRFFNLLTCFVVSILIHAHDNQETSFVYSSMRWGPSITDLIFWCWLYSHVIIGNCTFTQNLDLSQHHFVLLSCKARISSTYVSFARKWCHVKEYFLSTGCDHAWRAFRGNHNLASWADRYSRWGQIWELWCAWTDIKWLETTNISKHQGCIWLWPGIVDLP